MRIRSKIRSGQIGGLISILIMVSMDAAAQPQNTGHDDFSSDNGNIRVRQVQQMSVVIEAPSGVIYTDPTGGKTKYDGQPAPDIILVSHEHHEHYDADTLKALGSNHTRLVVPPFVMDRLPSQLRARATALANGMSSSFGAILVTAVPAYGLTGASAEWHPKGRGNGYIVSIDGQRIYVAGSSDAVPEMQHRNTKAARRLLTRLLKKQGLAPKRFITDKLRSYGAARRQIMPHVEHRSHRGLNNRAENSHLPFRKRERTRQGFRSIGSLQHFVSIFSAVRNHFVPARSNRSAAQIRSFRQYAMEEWRMAARQNA